MDETIPRHRTDRRQLQQIIAGLSDGVILLDPDGSIFWANEGALAMHGVTRLEDLGVAMPEYRRRFDLRYRNRHLVPDDQYPMARLIAGEAFQGLTVEVSKAGKDRPHRVHEIRGLILSDSAGDPDCLALVIDDVTQRYRAEDRFERMFAANPAPAIICRLSDLRYIKVNQGFLEMTGYVRDDVIGRSMYEIDVLAQVQNKRGAIERLHNGHAIPQTETILCLPNGAHKSIIVAGQPIDAEDEPCVLFSFIDLDLQKKAETALRLSDERFAKSFRASPVPMVISRSDDSWILDVNEAFLQTTGYAIDEIIGKNVTELDIWECLPHQQAIGHMLAKTGHIRDHDVLLRTKFGQALDCLISVETIMMDDQSCVLTIVRDLTERKRTEEELAAAIEIAMQDRSWFSRALIEKLATIRQPLGVDQPTAELADLTHREHEVLELVCSGYSNEQIACHLHLSCYTVRNHIATIYSKIGVHSRSRAIVWGRDRGITRPSPRNRDVPGPRTRHISRLLKNSTLTVDSSVVGRISPRLGANQTP